MRKTYSQPCMCGAMDCYSCRGSDAIDYVTPCENCGEKGEFCECGDYQREEADFHPTYDELGKYL